MAGEYQPKRRYTLQFKAEVTYEVEVECDTKHQALVTVQEGEFDWEKVIEIENDSFYDEAEITGVEYLTEDDEGEDDEDY